MPGKTRVRTNGGEMHIAKGGKRESHNNECQAAGELAMKGDFCTPVHSRE